MPYLKLSTNVELSEAQIQELPSELSQMVAKQTGKPERYVMVELSAGQNMLFGGSAEALAYLECKSIGLSQAQIKALSASLSQLLITALPPLKAERIYIEFSNCPAENWGWNGATFG
jgi:phenylpyruvate tautomerase PptA (4-oxalocrotonate tautomerase family)